MMGLFQRFAIDHIIMEYSPGVEQSVTRQDLHRRMMSTLMSTLTLMILTPRPMHLGISERMFLTDSKTDLIKETPTMLLTLLARGYKIAQVSRW